MCKEEETELKKRFSQRKLTRKTNENTFLKRTTPPDASFAVYYVQTGMSPWQRIQRWQRKEKRPHKIGTNRPTKATFYNGAHSWTKQASEMCSTESVIAADTAVTGLPPSAGHWPAPGAVSQAGFASQGLWLQLGSAGCLSTHTAWTEQTESN